MAGASIFPKSSGIAAHAVAIGATLVTEKIAHLGSVKGLVVENWRRPQTED